MSKNKPEDTNGKMKRRDYEKQLRKLQTELCRLQEWVVHKGLRVIVVFEGRDAAAKGRPIKASTERSVPCISLWWPTACTLGPGKRRRCTASATFAHFPDCGEVVIFDRSWYIGRVETVMGFCSWPSTRIS